MSRGERVRKQKYQPTGKVITFGSWGVWKNLAYFSVLAEVGTLTITLLKKKRNVLLDKNCNQRFWLKKAAFILNNFSFYFSLVFDLTPVRTFLSREDLNITGGNICNLKQSGPVRPSNYFRVGFQKRDTSMVNVLYCPAFLPCSAGIEPATIQYRLMPFLT